MKIAAMEGDYEDSGDPAAWSVVAWQMKADTNQVFGIKIPYMWSIYFTENHLVL
ncbi:cytochrome d oxidase, subunit I [Streptococcus agalactiae H36B]|nr:cytochrome d oxidase, subunit I [Streptococcus agalactiae H36B]